MRPSWQLPGVPQPPDWRLDWEELVQRNPVLAPLAECPQDPIWHPEGDVLEHTRLVVEALSTAQAWRSLAETTRSVVFTAALLHDLAKPKTTEHDQSGRLVAPGHASKGAWRVRRELYRANEMDLSPPPLAVREQIVDLVRHHGLPIWWLDRDHPERAAIRASLRVPGAWLALLAEADARGRGSGDRADLLERIDAFRELCRDAGCYDEPMRFATPVTRQVFLEGNWPAPETPAYDRGRFDVIVLSGLPGAGKDTWLAREAPNLPVVSLDDLRAELGVDPTDNQGTVIQAGKEAARRHLREQQPFVWNATNLSRSTRGSILDLVRDYRGRPRIVYLEAPYQELLCRNRERSDPVPLPVVEKLIDKLQLPDFDEAPKVSWVES